MFAVPSRFGKYELLEHFAGGMADVYRAQDVVLGRAVAVKILKEEGAADAEVRARFLAEARTVAALEHENIIKVFDYGENDGRPFMVMEFLPGEDLSSALRNGRGGDTANRLKLAEQVAFALEYVHSRGVVHRDIKPSNIRVIAPGMAKLIDFGIAKAPDATLKTRTGFAVGTIYYMAPEQVRGEAGKLADVYAFGLLLYELMVGERAIPPDSIERVFYKILNEPLDLVPLRAAAVPAAIIALVERCTAKAPDRRPQSFTAIREELREAMPGVKVPVARPSPSKMKWLYGAVAALALVGAGVFWSLHGKNEPKPVDHVVARPSTRADPAGDMVLVPAGALLFGEDKRTVDLPDFYIDKTEVTNGAYAAFAKEPRKDPEMPVTNIDFNQAREFCEGVGKRLPTAQEWEKAARGTDGRLYPWGDEENPRLANVVNDPAIGPHRLLKADTVLGVGPYGALNMTGNAWEYVDEPRTPVPDSLEIFRAKVGPSCSLRGPWFTVRGGSYERPLAPDGRTFEWMEVPACYRAADYGFRCVKTP